MGMVVEPSSTLILNCRSLAADCPILVLSNHHILVTHILWYKALRISQQLNAFFFIYFYMNSQFYIAAVINAILSSIVLPPSFKAEADLCIASPIPAEVMAKLLPTALKRSIILMVSSAAMP